MVGYHHQITNLEGRIHTTSGIRDKERLDAQLVHHANGEGDFLHVIALVVVKTTLHRHYIHPAQLTEDESTSMSLHRRYGEVGYFFIRDLCSISNF